jgi:hypothetical protein
VVCSSRLLAALITRAIELVDLPAHQAHIMLPKTHAAAAVRLIASMTDQAQHGLGELRLP